MHVLNVSKAYFVQAPPTMLATQAAAEPPPGVEVRAPRPSTKDRSEELTRGPSPAVPIRYLGGGAAASGGGGTAASGGGGTAGIRHTVHRSTSAQ